MFKKRSERYLFLSKQNIGVNKNIMKKLLANLIGKKFSVYVGNEFERMTDFIGFVKLLTNYSDFFQYTKEEQFAFLFRLERDRFSSIDADIFVKIGGAKKSYKRMITKELKKYIEEKGLDCPKEIDEIS